MNEGRSIGEISVPSTAVVCDLTDELSSWMKDVHIGATLVNIEYGENERKGPFLPRQPINNAFAQSINIWAMKRNCDGDRTSHGLEYVYINVTGIDEELDESVACALVTNPFKFNSKHDRTDTVMEEQSHITESTPECPHQQETRQICMNMKTFIQMHFGDEYNFAIVCIEQSCSHTFVSVLFRMDDS